MQKLVGVFKALQVDVLSRWRDTQRAVFASEHYKNDPELRELADLDMLLAFEDYNRVLERDFDDAHRKTEMERTMRDRKAREAFQVTFRFLVPFSCWELTHDKRRRYSLNYALQAIFAPKPNGKMYILTSLKMNDI